MSDPLAALDSNCFALSCFLMYLLALRLDLTLTCVVFSHFVGIMNDFAWRPFMKHVRPTSRTMPSSVATFAEGGQPVVEVGLVVVGIAEIVPSAPSSILAKRKRDDSVGLSGRKKSMAPSSLRPLRQPTGLRPGVGRLSVVQDMPPAPPVVEAPTANAVVVVVTLAPPPPPTMLV